MFLLVGMGKLSHQEGRGPNALLGGGADVSGRRAAEATFRRERFWGQGRAWRRELWKLPHTFHMQTGNSPAAATPS